MRYLVWIPAVLIIVAVIGTLMVPTAPILQVLDLAISGEVECNDEFAEFKITVTNPHGYPATVVDGEPKLSGSFTIPALGSQELSWKISSVQERTVLITVTAVWKNSQTPVAMGKSRQVFEFSSKECRKFVEKFLPS